MRAFFLCGERWSSSAAVYDMYDMYAMQQPFYFIFLFPPSAVFNTTMSQNTRMLAVNSFRDDLGTESRKSKNPNRAIGYFFFASRLRDKTTLAVSSGWPICVAGGRDGRRR